MMGDRIYKLFRKILPATLYRIIQRSPIGRAKAYETFPTYEKIFQEYMETIAPSFRGKIVAEVGSGNQIYTALFFLSEGADKVILIDPKIDLDSEKEFVVDSVSTFKRNYKCDFTENELRSKILIFHDLSEVPSSLNQKCDILLSHLVLEHVGSVESFYINAYRLLSPKGYSYNIVDLSDHTYHVFGKFKFAQPFSHSRALYHLRYSNKEFDLLNDRKCYMNRVLLPKHCELASKSNLRVEIPHKTQYRKVPIHKDLVEGIKEIKDDNDLYITSFHIKVTR